MSWGGTPRHTILQWGGGTGEGVQMDLAVDLQWENLAHCFIAQEKRCDSSKEKTLLPLPSGSRIIKAFLCGLSSPICRCCLLSGNESVTGSSNNSVVLVLWSLKSVSKLNVLSAYCFSDGWFICNRSVSWNFRKGKMFHKSPKKINVSSWTKCRNVLYMDRPPAQPVIAKGLCLSQHLPDLTGVHWEWGKGHEDDKPVPCRDMFLFYLTHQFINTNKTSLILLLDFHDMTRPL